VNYDRYEIIKELGRGSMGVVYQARDQHIDRLIAIKVMRRDRMENESFVKRFMKEARVIGRLSHPRVVTIQAGGIDMKKLSMVALTLLFCLALAQGSLAEDFAVKSGDTIRKVLENRVGTRVTLRLADGGELAGKVRVVTKELVQLGELSGRDYYDGVIELDEISAVIVRIKE
jgi:serine/threonine protein kinase